MKWNIQKSFRLFLASLGLLVTLGLPIKGAQAKHHYRYYYYPGEQVYYSPYGHRYYYMDNGAWAYGVAPPPSVRLGRHVSIDLGGPVPYVYHPTVIQQYPVVVAPY